MRATKIIYRQKMGDDEERMFAIVDDNDWCKKMVTSDVATNQVRR
jgi:hypothetical protein